MASRSSASRAQTSTRTPFRRGASAKAASTSGESARAWGGAPMPSRAPALARGRVTVKAAPWPVPGLVDRHAAAVQLHQVAHDGQPQAQARRARACWCSSRLPEALEDVGQEARAAMPAPVSPRVISRVGVPAARAAPATQPPRGVNLTALESRFQTTCCRRSGSPETGPAPRVQHRATRDALGLGRRPHRVERGLDRARQVHRPHVRGAACPMTIARDVEDVRR